jgi:fructosamine-3-kinase
MIARLWLRFVLRFLPAAVVTQLPDDRVQLQLERGRRAKTLMADETLAEAMSEIEARLTQQWSNTASHNAESRESLFHQVAALHAIRGQLKVWADDAFYLAAQIEKRR